MNFWEFADKHVLIILTVIIFLLIIIDNMWANWIKTRIKDDEEEKL